MGMLQLCVIRVIDRAKVELIRLKWIIKVSVSRSVTLQDDSVCRMKSFVTFFNQTTSDVRLQNRRERLSLQTVAIVNSVT